MPPEHSDKNARELQALIIQMQKDLAVVEEAFNKARASLTALLDKQKLALFKKDNFKPKF